MVDAPAEYKKLHAKIARKTYKEGYKAAIAELDAGQKLRMEYDTAHPYAQGWNAAIRQRGKEGMIPW